MRLLLSIAIIAMLAACGQTGGPEQPGASVDPGGKEQQPKEEAVKVMDRGEVVGKEGDRLLITAYVEGKDGPYIDAYWFTVNDQTEISDSKGGLKEQSDLPAGTRVEAWHTGAVAESYPAQTTAAKLIVLEDAEAAGEERISRAEAVQSALLSLEGATFPAAVKAARLDAENGYWNVELVTIDATDQPVLVRVNDHSGDIVPAPVAENEAFRVFSPAPGTEAGPDFTVEGEARVFEAAFRWTLEDGHNILAEGNEMAEGGAPAWGRFQFDVSYEKASQPNVMLILYINSAKDGSVQHELVIPLKAPEDRIQYKGQ